MKVCIIGSGYVGLVAAACFANAGNTVVAADVDEAKVAKLKRNEMPIYEPGLAELVIANQAAGRLSFTTDVPSAVRASEVIFIAVGTPPGEDGAADLTHVLNVARTIGQNLEGFTVVVDKSTVPVGTADKVAAELKAQGATDFAVVSNPEFLKEGAAIQDFRFPDRIVIGADDERARKLMEKLYAPFQRASRKIVHMDIRSAEMTKYAANAMLATRISFMNELSNLCDLVGADIEMVRHGIGSDPRIGPKFLYAGAGFGGSCFPKDVRALIRTGEENDCQLSILRAVYGANERQKEVLPSKIKRHFGDDLSGRTFAVWGLAFKPETDDMREAPSLVLIQALLDAGATVRASDPVACEAARELLPDAVTLSTDGYEILDGADALVIVTDWRPYRTPDFDAIRRALKTPVLFDGRNLYDPEELREQGFHYEGIGRPAPRG